MVEAVRRCPARENTAWAQVQLGNLDFNHGRYRRAAAGYAAALRTSPGQRRGTGRPRPAGRRARALRRGCRRVPRGRRALPAAGVRDRLRRRAAGRRPPRGRAARVRAGACRGAAVRSQRRRCRRRAGAVRGRPRRRPGRGGAPRPVGRGDRPQRHRLGRAGLDAVPRRPARRRAGAANRALALGTEDAELPLPPRRHRGGAGRPRRRPPRSARTRWRSTPGSRSCRRRSPRRLLAEVS